MRSEMNLIFENRLKLWCFNCSKKSWFFAILHQQQTWFSVTCKTKMPRYDHFLSIPYSPNGSVFIILRLTLNLSPSLFYFFTDAGRCHQRGNLCSFNFSKH